MNAIQTFMQKRINWHGDAYKWPYMLKRAKRETHLVKKWRTQESNPAPLAR